jgi:hypothetical protein
MKSKQEKNQGKVESMFFLSASLPLACDGLGLLLHIQILDIFFLQNVSLSSKLKSQKIEIFVAIYVRTRTQYLLCGLVLRVPGCKSSGPGFYSKTYQIFCVAVGLEQGPLSLVMINQELIERKSSSSCAENRY